MDEKILDLAKLDTCWSENLRRTGKVVDNGDWEYFNAHLLFDFSSGFFIFVYLIEFLNCIVIFVGELPPLWTELTDIGYRVLLQTFWERRKFFIYLDKVLEVELDITWRYDVVFTALLFLLIAWLLVLWDGILLQLVWLSYIAQCFTADFLLVVRSTHTQWLKLVLILSTLKVM